MHDDTAFLESLFENWPRSIYPIYRLLLKLHFWGEPICNKNQKNASSCGAFTLLEDSFQIEFDVMFYLNIRIFNIEKKS